jgi:hypothetical protein
MEKYGFVYIWLDRKHKRYYIGSHWGTEYDGYICSSTWMKQAYRHRPLDFKRKIIARIYSSKQDLINEENRWLAMIKPSEIKERYYNLRIHAFGHWSADQDLLLTVGQKISVHLRKKYNDGYVSPNRGRPMSEETRKKLSNAFKGRPLNYVRSEETRKKISENTIRLQKEHKIGMHGKKHTTETLNLMSKNNAMNDLINRKKIGDALKGTQGLMLNGNKKMARPNTEKWNDLMSLGYVPINKELF